MTDTVRHPTWLAPNREFTHRTASTTPDFHKSPKRLARPNRPHTRV
ncbi:hypothetical protein [Mobiluncus mulieris]|nr:hypothetical protein [Mobiluncus mulieris]